MSTHNLLVISDMHIAEGLLAEDGESAYGYEAFLYDGSFARFLRYHELMRRDPSLPPDDRRRRPWRLVLAGDIFDFWDIARVPGDRESLLDAIRLKQQELADNAPAVGWLWELRKRIGDQEALKRSPQDTTGGQQDPWSYTSIRNKLDDLGLSDGRQRRAVEELTWWTQVLARKGPGMDLSRRERRHGLGTTWQEVVWKLNLVYRGHRELFTAMAWFIACDNEVILLKGNHDLELYWSEVHCGHFCQMLIDAYQDLLAGETTAPAFDDYPTELRVDLDGNPLPDLHTFKKALPACDSTEQRPGQRFFFEEWFYYEQDLAYIEHGNQYEPADSSISFLNPRMPSDQDRIELPWGAFMVRYFYNKIVAVHPFAVNVKPEQRIIHWMLQHDLFRILGIVLAELPDILRALARAVKQGFRGSWIWGDHSILGLIPLLVYDLIQLFSSDRWQADEAIRLTHRLRRAELADRYSRALGIPAVAVAAEEEKEQEVKDSLYARFLLHLGAFFTIICLLLSGAGALFGWTWTGWLIAPLIVSVVVAVVGTLWSVLLPGPDRTYDMGVLLLQLGTVGAIAGLVADLFLARLMGWTVITRLLVVAVPLAVAVAGGALLWTSHSRQRAIAAQLFRRGWPARSLRSGASLLDELGLISTAVGAYYLFGPIQTTLAGAWLVAAVALFICAWVARRLRTLYINRRWLERSTERWLGSVQRKVRSACTVLVALLAVAILLPPLAWAANAVVDFLFREGGPGETESLSRFASQVYRFMTTYQVFGMPILVFLLLLLAGVILLQTGLRALTRRGEQGELYRRVVGLRLQPRVAGIYRKGIADRDVPQQVSVIAEQLEEIEALGRAEQRRWLGSLLGILTLMLPLVALTLLAIAILGGAAAFLNVVSPLLASVEPLKALGISVLFGFAYWLLRQISASTQRHDPQSGFGDLFPRMAIGIADILDAAGQGPDGPGLGRPRYFIFGHDHWADSQPLSGRRAPDPDSGQQWYVNSGTWLRGYVEEQQQQEVNENHSTFVQIIPGLGDDAAPRVLRWNDGANQPEHIVRRKEPWSASGLVWDRWEERWPWVLLWGILLAAAWALAPARMIADLRPVAWAVGLWFLSGALIALVRRLLRPVK